jgi:Flp pilus assembly pilin Flp
MLDYLRMTLTARTSERGASAVEYGLVVAGVAIACLLGFEALGFITGAMFEQQNSQIEKCHGC